MAPKRDVIDVYVKLPSGRVIQFDLQASDQVKKIYERVASEESVLQDQVRIKYTGKVLNKTSGVGYLGICKETILKAEIIKLKKINFNVKVCDANKVLSLTFDNVTKVKTIKESIGVQEGIPVAKQILKRDGVELSDPELLAVDANIEDGTELELLVRKLPDSAEATKVTPAAAGNVHEEGAVVDDEVLKDELLSSFHAHNKYIEVVFSFDTTGSMYPCLQKVRNKLEESVRRLLRDIPGIRIGIMAMGDYCDQRVYVIRSKDLTTDVEQLVDFVNSVPATAGGDAPECYEWVLRKAQELDWSEDSAKALVVIGDQVPHPASYTDQQINWHEELDLLTGMGIKVYGVLALQNILAQPFYEELADRSGGAHLQFQNFGLITDMFLAVCYKESSPEQLQAFCEEVDQEGRMTDEAREMFDKLEEAQSESRVAEKKEQPNERYVNAPWWDTALDTSTQPRYFYHAELDTWFNSEAALRKELKTSDPADVPTTSTSASASPARQKKKKESIWKKLTCGLSNRSRSPKS